MTTQKQTDANRRNALLSTGPRTEDGKQSSRGNAYRHGLTAETVIVGVEDAADYAAFEAEILSEYEPQSVVERELTLRLASILWRLRRAILIETGLLQMQCEPSSNRKGENSLHNSDAQPLRIAIRLLRGQTNDSPHDNFKQVQSERTASGPINGGDALAAQPVTCAKKKRAITLSFLHLAELPSAPFERIGRYEAALWRQFVQTLIALDEAKRHQLIASRHRFKPYPPQW